MSEPRHPAFMPSQAFVEWLDTLPPSPEYMKKQQQERWALVAEERERARAAKRAAKEAKEAKAKRAPRLSHRKNDRAE